MSINQQKPVKAHTDTHKSRYRHPFKQLPFDIHDKTTNLNHTHRIHFCVLFCANKIPCFPMDSMRQRDKDTQTHTPRCQEEREKKRSPPGP